MHAIAVLLPIATESVRLLAGPDLAIGIRTLRCDFCRRVHGADASGLAAIRSFPIPQPLSFLQSLSINSSARGPIPTRSGPAALLEAHCGNRAGPDRSAVGQPRETPTV